MQDEKLTGPQVAEMLDIKPSTWRTYVMRGQAPARDGQIDQRTPFWWRSTVEEWDASRPRVHNQRRAPQ